MFGSRLAMNGCFLPVEQPLPLPDRLTDPGPPR